RAGDQADPGPVGVPGQDQRGQTQAGGQVGGDAGAGVPVRVPGAGGSAELDRGGVQGAREFVLGGVQAAQPAGGDQAERDRQRVAQQGAAGHRGGPVGGRQRGGGVGSAAHRGPYQRQRVPGRQPRGGVQDVLIGGAE